MTIMSLPVPLYNHGDFTMAYSVVVDETIALFESGHGILGYVDTGKVRLFVGDPMCAGGVLTAWLTPFWSILQGYGLSACNVRGRPERRFIAGGTEPR